MGDCTLPEREGGERPGRSCHVHNNIIGKHTGVGFCVLQKIKTGTREEGLETRLENQGHSSNASEC